MGLSVTSRDDWQGLFSGSNLEQLSKRIFPEYLPKQRWFGRKTLAIHGVEIMDWVAVAELHAALVFVRPENEAASTSFYVVPLALGLRDEERELQRTNPRAVVAEVQLHDGSGVLYDAMWNDRFCEALLDVLTDSKEWTLKGGKAVASPSNFLPTLRGRGPLPVRRTSAEQSNTSVIFGDRLILKVFRHPEPGQNPDAEIGRFLTETAHFERIPSFGGTIDYKPVEGEPTNIAMLQGLVINDGDGWKWMLGQLSRFYDDCLENERIATAEKMPPAIEFLRQCAGRSLEAAQILGQRTAEMHMALASSQGDPAFRPEPMTAEDLYALRQNINDEGARALRIVDDMLPRLPESAARLAKSVLDLAMEELLQFGLKSTPQRPGARTRIHGDYHLGQVLIVDNDFVVLDFEGEPARPLEQRRSKQSPLKDVAGMLRSFSYAAFASLLQRPATEIGELQRWAELWDDEVTAAFLHAYRQVTAGCEVIPQGASSFENLLQLYLLEKVFYELVYELNNRPGWVEIPLRGLLALRKVRASAEVRPLRKAG